MARSRRTASPRNTSGNRGDVGKFHARAPQNRVELDTEALDDASDSSRTLSAACASAPHNAAAARSGRPRGGSALDAAAAAPAEASAPSSHGADDGARRTV